MPDPIVVPPVPDAAAPWFAAFDDATKGHIQAKGWDRLDAPAAMLESLKAWKSAESKLGIPADQVLRLPALTDAEGVKGVFQKLGVPADAAGYDFSTVKKPDGSAPDDALIGFLREQAAKHNLTKDGAAGLAAALVGRDAALAAEAASAKALKVAADKEALNTAWQGKADVNTFLAQRAAAMIGLDAETLNAVAEAVGYGKVMTGFLQMAAKMGEATLEGGGGSPPGGKLTVEQARARLADIKAGADKEFSARYFKGDKAAVDEMRNLTAIDVAARMRPAT